MNTRGEEEEKIVIPFTGDKEDYVNTVKALVNLVSNQNECNGLHTQCCCHLIEDMLNVF